MWTQFCIAALVVLALLYVPGYLFFRALRFSRILALCCAPLYAACAYAMLPILYYGFNIPCNAWTVVAPSAIVAIVLVLVSRPWKDGPQNSISLPSLEQPTIGKTNIPFDVVVPLIYLAVGLAATYILFVSNIDVPDSFPSRYDNQTHLNLIRSFLDSGKWSSLHESSYLAAPLAAIPTGSNSGSFYPASFHCLATLICSMLNIGVTTSINACLVILCGVVLPLSMFAFMRALLPNQRGAVLFGAVASFCFPNFPWNCFITGPLYPNLYGLALLPAVIAWVVSVFDARKAGHFLACLIPATVVSFAALALAHPNTMFSLYIFMAPYGASVIAMHVREFDRIKSSRTKSLLAGLAILVYAACIVGVWLLLYRVPALADVLGYMPAGLKEDIAQSDPLSTLLHVLYARRRYFLVAIPCALGCIPLMRLSNWKVIVFPVVFFAAAYVAMHCGWEHITYWMAAPWYSDNRRIALNVALYATPIAAYLADWLYQLPQRIAHPRATEVQGKHASGTASKQAGGTFAALGLRVCSVVLIAALGAGLVVFGFGRIHKLIHQRYNTEADHIYSSWECDFVNKAHAITGDDLVINMPHDGSLWSYGVNELNTYYRDIRTKKHTEDSLLIRKHLSEFSTNKNVRRAVSATGAKYVLLLDKDVAYEDGLWLSQYKEGTHKLWSGIDSIDDDTPGFELVLAEDDDMRLYRIAS